MQSCCPQCECVSVWARWLMAPGQIANAIQDVCWESWRWSAQRDKVCLPSEPASVVFRLCCVSLKSSAYVFKKACVEWKSQSLFSSTRVTASEEALSLRRISVFIAAMLSRFPNLCDRGSDSPWEPRVIFITQKPAVCVHKRTRVHSFLMPQGVRPRTES